MNQEECPHLGEWGYDDRGNHWCRSCNLWHDFPHEPDQNPEDCDESKADAMRWIPE